MQTCSKCQIQSPDEAVRCPNCGADLAEWSVTAASLKQFQQNPRVLYVRIMVYHNCCPACRQVEGAYAKESVPPLPIEGCSHPSGCRCFYQPVLDEVYP